MNNNMLNLRVFIALSTYFFSWTSMKKLCLQLSRLFCIKWHRGCSRPSSSWLVQLLSVMSSGITENNDKSRDVTAFIWEQASLERLYKLLYYLECSCKFRLIFLSLLFTVIISLPVSTEIETLEVFWNIHFKKINNKDRKIWGKSNETQAKPTKTQIQESINIGAQQLNFVHVRNCDLGIKLLKWSLGLTALLNLDLIYNKCMYSTSSA